MDIENTNKPDVILNKKSTKTADAKPESVKTDSKKKVVVKVSKSAAGKSKKTDTPSEEHPAAVKPAVKPVVSVKKVSAQSQKQPETEFKERQSDEKSEELKKAPSRSENKKTASDYPATQITQKEFNTTNIYLDIDKTTKDVTEKAINAIVNDKNTIDRLAFELQNKQFLKETDDFINEINERERNGRIVILILIVICGVGCVIPFILPFFNKECKATKNNTVNKNIIQAGLKPDIKEIATLVEKATLLKNDFKNIHDQVEINPTMFVKFDFLKTDFYEELSKIDWNKNQNKLLVEKYQLLVNHYADEMNNELKKIEDEFAKAVTENVNQVVEKIEIIKNS